MKKRLLATIPVLLVVSLCSYFPVHALEYISYTDYYSYDYGDVSINAQLSGIVSSRGSSYDYDPDIIQYNFSVTLTNKTNQFQVADINTFSFDFNTGVSGYFTVGTYKMGSGAFELVSSSDNTRDISWQIYPDYMRFYFKDAELLVLNPNETRSYTFSLIQEIPFNTNYNYINNSIVYSYITSSSSSSITIYNRPSSWSSNSIEDFISNESLPNTAIAYYQYLIEQGIEDQTLFNNIISILNPGLNDTTFYGSDISGMTASTHSFTGYITDSNSNNLLFYRDYCQLLKPQPVSRNASIYSVVDNTVHGYDFSIWDVPVVHYVSIRNDYNGTLSVPNNVTICSGWTNITLNNSARISQFAEVIESNGINMNGYFFSNNNMQFAFVDREGQYSFMPNGAYYYATVIVHNYFICDRYDSSMSSTEFKPSINSFSALTDSTNINATVSNRTWYSSVAKNFADIRDRIQAILDAYNANVPAAQDVTTNSTTNTNDIDTQHTTEMGYYSMANTNITNTGLSNFSLTADPVAGLGIVKDHFTYIWNKLGNYNIVYTFSLMFGIALMIIRHIKPIRRKQDD